MSAHAIRRPSLVKRLMQSRKGRILLTLGVLMFAGALVAFAAYLSTASMKGGGSSGTFAVKWTGTTAPVDLATSTVKNVSYANIAAGELNLPTGIVMYPGDTITFSGQVQGNAGSAPGYITGVSLPGIPAGYQASLIAGCGVAVTESAAAPVKVQIKMLDTASPDGKAWSLAAGAGVQASPQNQITAPTSCPAYTAP